MVFNEFSLISILNKNHRISIIRGVSFASIYVSYVISKYINTTYTYCLLNCDLRARIYHLGNRKKCFLLTVVIDCEYLCTPLLKWMHWALTSGGRRCWIMEDLADVLCVCDVSEIVIK